MQFSPDTFDMPTKRDEDEAVEKFLVCKGVGLKGKISLTITVEFTQKTKGIELIKVLPFFFSNSPGRSNAEVQPASFNCCHKSVPCLTDMM